MPKLDTSQNINSVQFKEQGSAPSTPAATFDQLYFKTDGPYYKNSAGTEVKLAGGATGTITNTVEDAATNTVTNTLTTTHNSTGTPAASFGTGLLVRGESSTTPDRDMGRIRWIWVTATDGSRTARGTLSAFDSSAERDAITWESLGTANPLVQIFGLFFIQGGAAYVVGATGTARYIEVRTSGSTRWRAGANGTAEGGSNAGSDYYIEAFSDAAASLGVPLLIARATGVTTLTANDAVTNTVTNELVVGHNTSGTPAANYGTGIIVKGESSTTVDREMARLRAHWVTATDASRAARGTLSAWDTAERDCFMWEASGTAAMLGFFGTAPITKPAPTGSRGGNAALASLLTALANLGLITDSTSA